MPRTRRPSPSATTSAPAARSLAMTASRCSGRQSRTSTLPRVIAAATSSVPASMRSGMIAWSIGCSSSTPSMVTSDVPAPRTLRAHLVEHAPELFDLGLARRILQRRAPARQRRRHHQVLGAGDGHHVEDDGRAAQPPRARVDVAVLELDARPHRLQALEVLIDRARADRAAARQRHARAAVARDQRPQHQHRRAHGLDQLVGRLVFGDRRRVDARDALAARPRRRRRGARAARPIVRTSPSAGTLR